MSIDEIKKILIKEIKKIGFPVGFLNGEADGYAGYYVENEDKVVALEYAEQASDLMRLSLTNLATLLENGVRPNQKGKKSDWETILEYKGYAESSGG